MGKSHDLRNNKKQLKELLMKNVKTDSEGKVLLSKNDEWLNEKEWDEMSSEIMSKKGILDREDDMIKLDPNNQEHKDWFEDECKWGVINGIFKKAIERQKTNNEITKDMLIKYITDAENNGCKNLNVNDFYLIVDLQNKNKTINSIIKELVNHIQGFNNGYNYWSTDVNKCKTVDDELNIYFINELINYIFKNMDIKHHQIVKRICPCGSDKVDVISCKKTQDHIIELTYICLDCGHTEKEKVYLYE